MKNFKQAAQSWKVGGLTGRGSAAYYSEKGRQLTMEMNRLNDMASNLQVIENRQVFFFFSLFPLNNLGQRV